MKIKRPDFEESKLVNLIRNPEGLTGLGAPAGGMRVGVKYHGQEVHLLVSEHPRKGEYRGKIMGFGSGGESCEGLTVGEEVTFRASSIFWISCES